MNESDQEHEPRQRDDIRLCAISLGVVIGFIFLTMILGTLFGRLP